MTCTNSLYNIAKLINYLRFLYFTYIYTLIHIYLVPRNVDMVVVVDDFFSFLCDVLHVALHVQY